MKNYGFSLGVVFIIALTLLTGMGLALGAVSAAEPVKNFDRVMTAPLYTFQNSLPVKIPIITGTGSQHLEDMSGDCTVYRGDNGEVYLHNLTSGQTITITAEAQPVRNAAVSQGVVVWHSELAGKEGLWGYYNPTCNDAGLFGTEIIPPFHINSRSETRGPALSGEMLVYMAWTPAGAWYIGLIELDADNNGIPDATEAGYDPFAEDLWVHLSCCPSWPQGYTQVLPDIYWGDDYKVACWKNDAGGDHIQCYDLAHDEDGDNIPDWQDEDTANPWDGQFRASANTKIDFDWDGIITVYRDLVVWTDGQDSDICGTDLHLIDLDLDNDRILNQYDPTPGDGPTEFVLIDGLWHQEHPDMWGSHLIWDDRQNSDIFAYYLDTDSNNNGIPNWKDLEWKKSERPAPDPAQFPVTSDALVQRTPKIWGDTALWEDGGEIYGALLEPPEHIMTTTQSKALYWFDQQTVHFSRAEVIPGYKPAMGQILRYKSFMQDDMEKVIEEWYSAIPGSYVIGFDFCNYGSDEQKQSMGKFGRGFLYDQGLAVIARTMLMHSTQAEDIARFVSGFQNDDGSFGFSFNGKGYGGQIDSFYDLNYLRGGANGWFGYGLIFYSRIYDDPQFMDVLTRLGDYILTLQIKDTNDRRYGLFRGGYGRWFEDLFFDENIEWISTEHNIDIYFYLRDLGQLTGEDRFIDAANLQKENMSKLWNEEKGRFDQGMGPTGNQDDTDALDAASWGAMYWIAIADLEKAKRSLEYADEAYKNTVIISPTLSIEGYKPHSGLVDGAFDWATVNLVWSEGSLGVAMANLKMGYTLLDQCNPQGNMYVQKARDIVTEMDTLQTLDTRGGLMYAVTQDVVPSDFPQAPSIAGTAWFLMVQRAIEDRILNDTFWGPDPGIPETVSGFCSYLPLIMKISSG